MQIHAPDSMQTILDFFCMSIRFVVFLPIAIFYCNVGFLQTSMILQLLNYIDVTPKVIRKIHAVSLESIFYEEHLFQLKHIFQLMYQILFYHYIYLPQATACSTLLCKRVSDSQLPQMSVKMSSWTLMLLWKKRTKC